jgi:AraC family transcriptional regulator, regulatory protein of adaptative response / DNA-3-methyladenine glycosylase II
LDSFRTLQDTISQLSAIEGMDQDMAHYIAMRALGEPDAFPLEGALISRLGPGEIQTSERALSMAEGWRPWRAYAAMHLWADSAAL